MSVCSHSLALFLDVDGTLIDLADRPDLVVVPPMLPELLRTLSDRLGGALALVSGRALADIDRLFPGLACVAGSHGGEWRQAGTMAAASRRAPQLDRLATQAALLPGILVERKPLGVALHYRDNPVLAPTLRRMAQHAVEQAAEPLKCMNGKAVVEVMPAGIDKGGAVARFMTAPAFAGRRPVFIGDDVTDESGFVQVNRMEGLSIRVGGTQGSAARRALSSPKAVRRWLHGLETRTKGGCNHGQS